MRLLVAIAAAVALLAPVLASGAPEEPTVAFVYRGDGEFTGHATGGCLAYGSFLDPPAAILVEGEGVALKIAVTWINRTSVRPGHPEEVVLSSPTDYSRHVGQESLPDGRFRITPHPGAVIAFRPASHPGSQAPTLNATFDGGILTWSSIREGVGIAPHMVGYDKVAGPQMPMNGLSFHDGQYPRGARGWTSHAGTVSLTGATVMHVRDVSIMGPGVDLALPSYVTEVQNETTPLEGARVTSYRLEEAFLEFDSLRTAWSGAKATVACRDVSASMMGELTLFQATGTAKLGDVVPFARQVLQISGDFRLDEAPSDAADDHAVTGLARGDIRVVGIDFQVAAVVAPLDAMASAVGGTLVALAFMAAAKKLAPTLVALLARLSEQDVTEHPMRRQILGAVAQGPIVGEGALVFAVGGSRGTVRHHAEVLVRAGKIRSVSLAGQTLFLAPGADESAAFLALVKGDERLLAAHEAFLEGLERPDVTKRLRARFGVSSRAARKYVQRYLELGIGSTSGAKP